MSKEIRLYSCGCVDYHNDSLWSSQCVEHCADHSFRADGTITEQDENPAECEGVAYVVRKSDYK
jgi:hypothetical protein